MPEGGPGKVPLVRMSKTFVYFDVYEAKFPANFYYLIEYHISKGMTNIYVNGLFFS